MLQESVQAPRQQASRKMAVSAQLSPLAPQAEQGEDVCMSSPQMPSGLVHALGGLPDIALQAVLVCDIAACQWARSLHAKAALPGMSSSMLPSADPSATAACNLPTQLGDDLQTSRAPFSVPGQAQLRQRAPPTSPTSCAPGRASVSRNLAQPRLP